MTTPKPTFAGFALIAVLCAGFTLGLTAPAWAGFDEGMAAYDRGDYATAIRELRPLAEQGNADAQFNLGVMYANGLGGPQDYSRAVKWYRKAAEQGYAQAQYYLGLIYEDGLSVPQDHLKAHVWFNLAASGPSHGPYGYRDISVMGRDRVAKKMTPAQLSEAQKLAREWKPK